MTLSAQRRRTSPAFTMVRPGTVRVAGLGPLPVLLEHRRVPLSPLLDAAGLPRTLFDDEENLVDIASAGRLLDVAAKQSGCPHLGLLCGRRFSPNTIGIVGRLAQNASDVGSALRGLILNLHLHGHAFVPTLGVVSGTAEFGMRLSSDLQGNTVPAVDLGMAAAFTIVSTLCGPHWMPLEVLLVHQPFASRKPYDSAFGVRVQFGSDRNAITFDAAWLTRRVHGANATRRALLERELAVIAQQHQLPAATTARRALIACIARGNLSVDAVAAVMRLHPRTLNRRLAREGTSLLELTKAVRFQIARDLLENTALPITEIAATLLYANIGAFTRAFRLWSRASPSEWRVNHGRARQAHVPPDREHLARS